MVYHVICTVTIQSLSNLIQLLCTSLLATREIQGLLQVYCTKASSEYSQIVYIPRNGQNNAGRRRLLNQQASKNNTIKQEQQDQDATKEEEKPGEDKKGKEEIKG